MMKNENCFKQKEKRKKIEFKQRIKYFHKKMSFNLKMMNKTRLLIIKVKA